MNQLSCLRAVRSAFTIGRVVWRASLVATFSVGLVAFSACDEAPAKKSRQYKALKIKDTGNHVRNYVTLSRAYTQTISNHLAGLTPQQRVRNRATQDSLSRLPYSPERENLIAQLMGFESAQAKRELNSKVKAEHDAAMRTNPSFFKKSWPEKRKWLLLSQGSAVQESRRID